MQLTPSDLRSDTWRRISAGVSERLQELRESNDSLEADQIKTAATRGRIAELKRMLSLADEASDSSSANPTEVAFDMAVFNRD